MSMILNKAELAINPLRSDALEILEAGLTAVQTPKILESKISVEDGSFSVLGSELNLLSYRKVIFIGIGKCAFEGAQVLERKLGGFLSGGIALGVGPAPEQVSDKIRYLSGTHPYPSEENVTASRRIVELAENLTADDLVITLISGGGSSLFEIPANGAPLNSIIQITKDLTSKGADIYELNTVRKHLSAVKGGQFAKLCHPAQVVSLIFSDVLGNDISMIASGPTVIDPTTAGDAAKIIEKHGLALPAEFVETPKDPKYFEKVKNFLLASNADAVESMESKAEELGYSATIETDRLSGDACEVGRELASRETAHKTCILMGGETTVKIPVKHGEGGRNQTMALSALPNMKPGTVLVCASSDGWDNSEHGGAIADSELFKKAGELGVDPEEYLRNFDSFNFFKKAGGAISTGKLGSNVSDLVIMIRSGE